MNIVTEIVCDTNIYFCLMYVVYCMTNNLFV